MGKTSTAACAKQTKTKQSQAEAFDSGTDFTKFKKKCNWCNRYSQLAPGKPYCNLCKDACYRECQRCHKPFTSPKFFILDEKRCDPCHRKLQSERENRARKKDQQQTRAAAETGNLADSEEDQQQRQQQQQQMTSTIGRTEQSELGTFFFSPPNTKQNHVQRQQSTRGRKRKPIVEATHEKSAEREKSIVSCKRAKLGRRTHRRRAPPVIRIELEVHQKRRRPIRRRPMQNQQLEKLSDTKHKLESRSTLAVEQPKEADAISANSEGSEVESYIEPSSGSSRSGDNSGGSSVESGGELFTDSNASMSDNSGSESDEQNSVVVVKNVDVRAK